MLDPNSTKTPTASTQDDNLSALADRIRDEHKAARSAMCHAVTHAISAGEALIQAKAAVPPGNWHHWLRSNCELSRRTALRYIQFAGHRARAIRSRIAPWCALGALPASGCEPSANSRVAPHPS